MTALRHDVFFDIDLADDIAQTANLDVGLNAALWIFDSVGHFIGHASDSDFFQVGAANQGTDPGSDIYGDRDPFIGALHLASGTYYAVVSNILKNPNSVLADLTLTNLSLSGISISGSPADFGFLSGGQCGGGGAPAEFGCHGQYQLEITTLPEPYTACLLAVGVAAASRLGRRRRRNS